MRKLLDHGRVVGQESLHRRDGEQPGVKGTIPLPRITTNIIELHFRHTSLVLARHTNLKILESERFEDWPTIVHHVVATTVAFTMCHFPHMAVL